MKRLRIVQTFQHANSTYYTGDLRTVSDANAVEFCRNGWAEDSDGELETGAPDLSPKKLVVNKAAHKGFVKLV